MGLYGQELSIESTALVDSVVEGNEVVVSLALLRQKGMVSPRWCKMIKLLNRTVIITTHSDTQNVVKKDSTHQRIYMMSIIMLAMV